MKVVQLLLSAISTPDVVQICGATQPHTLNPSKDSLGFFSSFEFYPGFTGRATSPAVSLRGSVTLSFNGFFLEVRLQV